MKLLYFVSFLGLAFNLQAQEIDLPDFSVADANSDAVLSIEEAENALRGVYPDIDFEDTDNSGTLTQREAERELPGLVFDDQHHEANMSITEQQYIKIVEAIKREKAIQERLDQEL